MRWERTSWTKVELAPGERLRYALIAPRLLAPHGNRGVDNELLPEQALALAVQMRIANLRDYTANLQGVPTLGEMAASQEWTWRFVDAFLSRVFDEGATKLVAVAAETSKGAGRAAASVAGACALHDLDRIDEALALLDQALAATGYGVVDRAWLEAQRARFRRQVGRLDEALTAARQVRADLASVRGDATADAVDAGAAAVVASITRFDVADMEAAIASGDTVAAWWRSQEIVAAGNEIAERVFSDWARDPSVTFAREDAAANRLRGAEMETTHAIDQGGWANRQLAIGRDLLLRLDRHSEVGDAAEGLLALRRSGNAKALRLAISRLLGDGPAEAISLAAESMDLRSSTHTGSLADLTLLEQGGDVLREPVAARFATELLDLAFDPEHFAERTTPDYVLGMQVAESLGGIILAAGAESQRRLISRLAELPAQKEPLVARAWARLLWQIPQAVWNEADARAAARDADRHDVTLARALRGVAWRQAGLAEARTLLIDEALGGSLLAIGELGKVTALSEADASRLITSVAAGVRDVLERARAGSTSIGGADPAEALAVLDLWHPGSAEWDPLAELLGDDAVPDSAKLRAVIVLAGGAEGIPEPIRVRLRPLVRRAMRVHLPRPAPFEGEPDLRGPALDLAVAIGAVESREASRLVFERAGGDAASRRWAAQVASRLGGPENVGLLIALAVDIEPNVRAAAAGGLATMLGRDEPTKDSVLAAVRRAADEPGVAVPEAVARGLARGGWAGEAAARLRDELRGHASATVRLIATQAETGPPAPNTAGGVEPEGEATDNPYARRRLEELREQEKQSP